MVICSSWWVLVLTVTVSGVHQRELPLPVGTCVVALCKSVVESDSSACRCRFVSSASSTISPCSVDAYERRELLRGA